MVDSLTREKRSWNMSRIKSGDTKPEKVVRSLLHLMGYRYRLHCKDLPGKPDIMLPKYKTVIFVHGCFWHRHSGCKNATTPKTNTEFWEKKFFGNIVRDRQKQSDLELLGWNVIIVWECETEKSLENLALKLQESILHPLLQTANNEDMLMVAETRSKYGDRKP
ncbi:MAG: very short patch repair endonuclease [Proteobacteria bacterium]|nr:very short patch repair endonuclease [Pseudomonadota bacterium]